MMTTRLGVMALAIVLTLAQCATGKASSLSCEFNSVRGLEAWSVPAQEYWTRTISKALRERVDVFLATGRFEPRTYILNGNLAGITSATLQRVRDVTETAESDKAVVGQVAGTEIPVYDVVSRSNRRVEDEVRFMEVAYRLPVRTKDLPEGARETVVLHGTCRGGSLAAGVRRRVFTKALSPD